MNRYQQVETYPVLTFCFLFSARDPFSKYPFKSSYWKILPALFLKAAFLPYREFTHCSWKGHPAKYLHLEEYSICRDSCIVMTLSHRRTFGS